LILRLAHRNKWYDLPDTRKIHTGLIPRLGGPGLGRRLTVEWQIEQVFHRLSLYPQSATGTGSPRHDRWLSTNSCQAVRSCRAGQRSRGTASSPSPSISRRPDLFLVSADGSAPPRDLTPGKADVPPFSLGGPDDYEFSPDSKQIAFASDNFCCDVLNKPWRLCWNSPTYIKRSCDLIWNFNFK
jgi:hypothetical protein